MIIDEGSIRFEFGRRWDVMKLDEHLDYRERLAKVDGTKAVDFLGIVDQESLYFIEVKDFRDHRIENKERLQTGELANEVGQKVRDSIACIVGAYRTTSFFNAWHLFSNLLHDKRKPIIIVVWLEYDLPTYPRLRRKALASIGANVFKTKLGWLTSRVIVANAGESTIPDLQVHFLKKSV